MSEASDPPFWTSIDALAVWALLFVLGRVRDLIMKRVIGGDRTKGQAPLRQDKEDFFTRRIYYRVHDAFNKPVASAPDAYIQVLERNPPDGQKVLAMTGDQWKCMNLGSYNYLGFAAEDPYCTPRVQDTLQEHGWSLCSPRAEAGTHALHMELERRVADFLGKEAAMVFGMGFATNTMVLPALSGPGSLILSDALNHASIVAGVRGSGAKVKVFAHNSLEDLERVLRASIAEGQPRFRRPWKKILVVVEGIYSMEGEMVQLQEVAALCKRYKAYLYLDEAHSIGAMGDTGRGMIEYSGTDPADVTVAMGTFTKSFGSCGGYIAADKEIIDYLRWVSPASLQATSISLPAAQQVISAMDVISGADGSGRGHRKIMQLRSNANTMRRELEGLGLGVLGSYDSPVVPVMLYHPCIMSAFHRMCLARGLAVVVVGFPATPLLALRARFCISAAHDPKDLQQAVQTIKEVATILQLTSKRSPLALASRINESVPETMGGKEDLGPKRLLTDDDLH